MITMPTNFTDPGYFKLLTIWHNQTTQDAQNKKAHDEYVTVYNNWMVANQQLQAYNKPLQAPLTPPQQVTYNDDGSTTLTSFSDLLPTVLPPATSTPSGNIVGTPAMDRTDAILLIVTEILNKLNGGK